MILYNYIYMYIYMWINRLKCVLNVSGKKHKKPERVVREGE